MIKANRYLTGITLFYILTSLWGIWGQGVSQEFFYLITVVFFLLSFLGMILTRELQICKYSKIDIISALMVGVWAYGVMIGLFRGNNKIYIIRNFAGLVLYISMFFIRRGKIDTQKLQKAIIILSVIQMIMIPLSYYAINFGYSSVFYKILVPLGMGTNMDTDGSISIWANNPNLVFVIYCFCLYKCLYEKKWLSKYPLLVVLCAVIILYCAKSGGILLELLALTALMIWVSIKQKTKKWSIIVYGILFIIGVIILYKPLSVLFDVKDDTNNQTRLTQIKYIFNNFSIIGHGLGAEYTEIGKDYGIEVIYLDLLYKFGVFAFIILGIYVYTVLSAIKQLQRSKNDVSDSIPLALMGYLFVAAGNPILYAGPSVISHVVALLLLENSDREKDYILNEVNAILG